MARADAETAAPPPPDPRRALTLDQVLGNDGVRAFLRRTWEGGRLPQALCFCGPAGIGKTTLAYALVREIVAAGGDPARHPRALKIARGVHPDLIEVTSRNASSVIKVGDIRALEDRVATAPLESPRKIVLIEPAHRMNKEAANCLLKLLEEPPPHLLLFLITSEINRLLTTIRSRCTPIILEPVPVDRLASWLAREARIDQARAGLVASLAEGRPGYALELARAKSFGEREKILAALARLAEHGFSVVFNVAETLGGASSDLSETFATAMTLLRDALVLKMRGQGILHHDLGASLADFGRGRSPEGLLRAAERLAQAATEAPFFYTPQARNHFVDMVVTDVGRLLRS